MLRKHIPTIEDRLVWARQNTALSAVLYQTLALAHPEAGLARSLESEAYFALLRLTEETYGHLCAANAVVRGGNANTDAPDVEVK